MHAAETLVLSHLTEVESLDKLAREGFNTADVQKILTSETSRKIMSWAMETYFNTGRQVPISKTMMIEAWGDEMDRAGIEIDDETELDPLEHGIEVLRVNYLESEFQNQMKKSAMDLSKAALTEKYAVLDTICEEFNVLRRTVSSRKMEFEASEGITLAIDRYRIRQLQEQKIRGLIFGMDEIDQYTKGIQEGELCVYAAGSGFGKSWVGMKPLWEGWRVGKKGILFTLENSPDMTIDRLICQALGVNYEAWQDATCSEAEMLRVKKLQAMFASSDKAPSIVMAESGKRTATAMVRRAISEGYDFIVIDQLSYIEPPPGFDNGKVSQRNVFSAIMRELKTEISEHRDKIPCLLLHQINREGKKDLAKEGKYEFHHIAESAEIERTADFVFAGFQSERNKRDGMSVWQTMKGRRVGGHKSWALVWDLGKGYMAVEHELEG